MKLNFSILLLLGLLSFSLAETQNFNNNINHLTNFQTTAPNSRLNAQSRVAG
jgi:hypothetical protein